LNVRAWRIISISSGTQKEKTRRVDMTMIIEVGKAYMTRDGQRVRITGQTNYPGTYSMIGEDDRGRVTWRSRTGRFYKYPHRLDLVSELEDAVAQ